MTIDQARNILGISYSIGLKEAQTIYAQKCRKLQIRMIPGNLCADRMKAQNELAELTTAWKTFSNGKSTEKKNKKAKTGTATKQNQASKATAYTSTHNLGGLWDGFFDMLPLPKPLATIFMIAVFVLVFISLLKTL